MSSRLIEFINPAVTASAREDVAQVDLTKFPLQQQLSQEVIWARRNMIRSDLAHHLPGGNVNAWPLSNTVLRRVFDLYDHFFFGANINRMLTGLHFDIYMDKTFARAAAYAGEKCGQYYIRFSLPIFARLFSKGETGHPSGGFVCQDRLACLCCVLEHEMVHMYRRLLKRTKVAINTSCSVTKRFDESHGQHFKAIVYGLFRQTDIHHSLGVDAGKIFDIAQIKVGDIVGYETKKSGIRGAKFIGLNRTSTKAKLQCGNGIIDCPFNYIRHPSTIEVPYTAATTSTPAAPVIKFTQPGQRVAVMRKDGGYDEGFLESYDKTGRAVVLIGTSKFGVAATMLDDPSKITHTQPIRVSKNAQVIRQHMRVGDTIIFEGDRLMATVTRLNDKSFSFKTATTKGRAGYHLVATINGRAVESIPNAILGRPGPSAPTPTPAPALTPTPAQPAPPNFLERFNQIPAGPTLFQSVYLTTHEFGADATLTNLASQPRGANSIHIGVAAWFNLSIMAQRRSAIGVIIDANPANREAMNFTFRLVAQMATPAAFVNEFIRLLPAQKFTVAPSEQGLTVEQVIRLESIKPNSWLAPSHYDYIRALIIKGDIMCITNDIRNTTLLSQIPTFANFAATYRVDTIYLSNVNIFMTTAEDQAAMMATLKAWSTPTTLVILCPPTPTDTNPRVQQVYPAAVLGL